MSTAYPLPELQAKLEHCLMTARSEAHDDAGAREMVPVLEGALWMLLVRLDQPIPEHLAHVHGTPLHWAKMEEYERAVCEIIRRDTRPEFRWFPARRDIQIREAERLAATYRQLQEETFERMMS